jgi:hypothetical protein
MRILGPIMLAVLLIGCSGGGTSSGLPDAGKIWTGTGLVAHNDTFEMTRSDSISVQAPSFVLLAHLPNKPVGALGVQIDGQPANAPTFSGATKANEWWFYATIAINGYAFGQPAQALPATGTHTVAVTENGSTVASGSFSLTP